LRKFILKQCRHPFWDLATFIVLVGWFLIPTQVWKVGVFLYDDFRQENIRQNAPAYKAKIHIAEGKIIALLQHQTQTAKSLGVRYSPELRSADMEAMWSYSYQLTGELDDPRHSSDTISHLSDALFTISRRYIRDGFIPNATPENIQQTLRGQPYTQFTQNEAHQHCVEWLNAFSAKHSTPSKIHFSYSATFLWLLCLYFGSLPFALLHYLLEISNESEMEQVLGNRYRLLYAIFLWPGYVGRYPRNYWREFWIEAFLRLQFTHVWRRIRPEERREIIRLSQSSHYQQWIREQWRNRKQGHHSLAMAVAATALCLFCSLGKADSAEPPPLTHNSGGIHSTITTRAGPSLQRIGTESSYLHLAGYAAMDNQADLVVPLQVPHPVESSPQRGPLHLGTTKERSSRIEHVPLTG
jgi:hypothetical protein